MDAGDRTGAGFAVNDGSHVLTLAHLVRGISPLRVRDSEGSVRQASVTAFHQVADLALLELPSPLPSSLGLASATSPVEAGLEVAIVGLAEEGNAAVATLTAVKDRTELKGVPVLDLEEGYRSFMSGAPLVDEQGQVVGLANAGIPSDGEPSSAIPAATIRRVLRGLLEGRSVTGVPFTALRRCPEPPGDLSPAESLPPFPDVYEGGVFIQEAPAPDGAIVEARLRQPPPGKAGPRLGTCWITPAAEAQDGRYRLKVSGPWKGWLGARIEFFVNGVKTGFAATYRSGLNFVEHDLRAGG